MKYCNMLLIQMDSPKILFYSVLVMIENYVQAFLPLLQYVQIVDVA